MPLSTPPPDRHRKWFLSLAFSLVFAFSATPIAVAQDIDDNEGLDAIEQAFLRGRTYSGEHIEAPAITLAALDARWEIYRDSAPASDQESQNFESLRNTVRELGMLSLPAHSLVLLQEADEAVQNGDAARAEALREMAASLSPESAQPDYLRARIVFEDAPWNGAQLTSELQRAYFSFYATPSGRLAINMQLRALALTVGILFALLFSVTVLFRHGGLLAHDLRILARKAITIPQARVLVGLLAVAPALVLWSPVTLVLAALLLSAAYMDWGERLVSLCVVAFLVVAPTLTEQYARFVAATEQGTAVVAGAIQSPCDERCRTQLQARIRYRSDDLAALALSWVEYRSGAPEDHATALSRLQGRELSGAMLSSAELLRGNIAFAGGCVRRGRTALPASRRERRKQHAGGSGPLQPVPSPFGSDAA